MHFFLSVTWMILRAADFLLLLRALLSWFPIPDSITEILHTVTEPIILPMRILFDKLGIDVPIPIDMPFLCTFILLSILESLLF